MLYDLVKYRLLKKLEEEAEKTVNFIAFVDAAAAPENVVCNQQIQRAILRYYALDRRIDKLKAKLFHL